MRIVIIGLPAAIRTGELRFALEEDLRRSVLIDFKNSSEVDVDLVPALAGNFYVTDDDGPEIYYAGVPGAVPDPPTWIFEIMADNIRAFAAARDIYVRIGETIVHSQQ